MSGDLSTTSFLLRVVRCVVFAMLCVASAADIVRLDWDGGSIPSNPSPGDYRLEDFLPGPSEGNPICGVTPPGETNRIIFLGQDGLAREATNFANPVIRPFLDLRQSTFFFGESGLLGMAFHPQFKSNGWVFVYYSWQAKSLGMTNFYNRLSRFTVTDAAGGVPDPDSEVVLFNQEDPDQSHNSGHLQFGPDGYLYVSVGDGSYFATVSQRIDGGFYSGILRIDVDRRAGSLAPNPGYGANPAAYSVPSDNPFVGMTNYSINGRTIWSGLSPESLRTEFFAIGMRNPWQFDFDPLTGDLWANDVGNNAREEINLVRKGGNYGWPWWEGTINVIAPDDIPAEPPVFEYSHFSGRLAITGGRFYRGSAYPELDGTYLFCDLFGEIGSLRYQGTNPPVVRWIASLPYTVTFGTDPRDGTLLLFSTTSPKVKRLVRNQDAGHPWPELLSETGLFESLKPLVPRAGLQSYEINVPFWSDYALKQRWFGIPGTNATMTFHRDGAWEFPEGTIWVKHFDRPYYRPSSMPFPTETRVLIKTTNGIAGASYRWNDDGTEAELVPPEGVTGGFILWSPDELVFQEWRFPSRNECQACHTPVTGGPAGFNTAQLNREVASGAKIVSQLDAFARAGYFSKDPENVDLMPSLAALDDETQTLERRVRSYLAANCAHCHQPGGVTRASWDARMMTSLEDSGLLNRESVPLGSDVLSLIEPGQPDKSALFLRISQLGQSHMPPLATTELNHAAISLVSRWITNDLPVRERYATWAANRLAEVPPERAVKSADIDGDGLNNYLEYLLHENPENGVVRWKMRIAREGAGYSIRFPRLTGRRFEVEWSEHVGPGAVWQRLERVENDPRTVTADGEAAIPIPDTVTHFYRVRISEE